MKIMRSKTASSSPSVDSALQWKILVVDDEPGIHALTALTLNDFRFSGYPLAIFNAYSAQEAREILLQHPDMALAIIDVVMETTTAGLELIDHIRIVMNNPRIRLVVRTGQPGIAPERQVIDRYDIDDYKEKTELTAQKLYTTIRCALKSYKDLMQIESTKLALTRILNAGSELLRMQSMEDFFQGMLAQVLALCRIGEYPKSSSESSNAVALIATADHFKGHEIVYRCGTSHFQVDEEARAQVIRFFTQVMPQQEDARPQPGTIYLPLLVRENVMGFIYLNGIACLAGKDWQLLFIMANQCAAFLENYWLSEDLKIANQEVIYRLAVASEFKDQETGNHINRIVFYTRKLAETMQLPEEDVNLYAEASMLHDIGKMGIPDHILQKPGKLTDAEFEVIKQHPWIGLKIMGERWMFELARQIIFCHHEKWDGSGYPHGLRGTEIPVPGRIVAVADVFDALTSRRPYKEPWPVHQAMEHIIQGAGSHFDPEVVDALMQLHKSGELDRIRDRFPGEE